ncbi:uncharacterized protein LOC101849392 [Aplysia californica]|uniref:Uncharacterized protein LOC101849392 n=1 Tax=Aplysia californica TaxID=6500 RepID=A0ABM0JZ05_APLCA|nr:uncharacterized protein LOC101849392 [Aplysia californica]
MKGFSDMTLKSFTYIFLLLLCVVIHTGMCEEGCGQGCQSLGNDNHELSRCVRYACRRRVFRYYIRFGKRGGGGGVGDGGSVGGMGSSDLEPQSLSDQRLSNLPRHEQLQHQRYLVQRRRLQQQREEPPSIFRTPEAEGVYPSLTSSRMSRLYPLVRLLLGQR